MTEPNAFCYFNNDAYSPGDFIRHAFPNCWDYMTNVLHQPTQMEQILNHMPYLSEAIFNGTALGFAESHVAVKSDTFSYFKRICLDLDISMEKTDFCEGSAICMQMATSCCDMQIAHMDTNYSGHCRPTWDGLTCFDSASANSVAWAECPESLPFHQGKLICL
ncbi:hypothetical protein ElyMa_004475600 [Elysia marginata]|uniref:G-protein coupled receptors family 2 profile 1 domain-containing protein n=1 Tax=Elysia marginata TaxID=1093978 RepID=A0AAV4HGT7_9GAST|nr:hypothetical protein ElyMa_004475600 [Elysia marginata]